MKERISRLISILLTFGMILTLIPAMKVTACAAWDGSGKDISWYVRDTSVNVFAIADENDLAGFATLVNAGASGMVTYDSGTGLISAIGTTVSGNSFSGKTIILTADLNLGGITDWTPIGTDSNRFQGTFNGCGCTVSGIRISVNPSGSGLFGCVGAGGTVRNLTVAGTILGDYDWYYNAGGIAGANYGIVQNCFSTCTINVSGQFCSSFGGVVGYNEGSVKNCGNTGTATITAAYNGVNAGGVVGENNAGTVQNCNNTGSLSMNGGGYPFQYFGGVSGHQYLGTLQNCYNAGTVTLTNGGAGSFSGGVEGYSMGGTVSDCYWSIPGGSGIGFGGGTDIRSFDVGGTLSTAVTIDGVAYTCLQDALNAWVGSDTNNRSCCYWNVPASAPVFYTNWSEIVGYAESGVDYSLTGTAYTVNTALGLAKITSIANAAAFSGSVTLTDNIDLSLYEWTPIGTDTKQFVGTFDGGSFAVQNLYINTSADYQGFFSYVGSGGLMENLKLTGCSIIGDNNCGGMIGGLSGTAQNCNVTGVICCSGSCGGGITARAYTGGVVRLCSADVNIIDYGTLYAGSGGIVGGSQGTVQDCFSSGYVTSGKCAGGIVGYQYPGTVKNCYATGTVSGPREGRVVGYNAGGTIQNCYYLTIAGVTTGGSGGSLTPPSLSGTATAKTALELSTAEIAWILNTTNGAETNSAVWSQGTIPVFADSSHLAVYRVLLTNSSDPTTVYSAADGSVTLPTSPTVATGMTFLAWYADPAFAAAYTAPSVLTQDATVYGNFGVRIINAGNYNANYTGSAITYAGTVTDNAAGISGATPLLASYYTDSAGTIQTTSSNSGAASNSAAPARPGTYYVRVSAAATDSGGILIDAAASTPAMMTIIDNTVYTNYYSVTAVQSAGGTFSPSSKSVAEGQSVTFSITPDKGYEIADVLVNGVSVGADASCTVKNVVSDITVKAVFKKIWSNAFKDVSEQAWYYESVRFASANGLFNGTGPGTFDPEGSMTRGMFVTALYRLSEDTGSYTNGFSDVPSGAWYENAVAWAAKNGIVSGIGNNRFAPDGGITREQFAVLLYNYAKYKGYDVSVGEDTNILSYGDALSISEHAYSALQWACGADILNGDDSGNLNPRSCATRAEVAAILQRFIENVTG